MFDTRDMQVKYEHTSLSRSNVTGKVKVGRKMYRQTSFKQYVPAHYTAAHNKETIQPQTVAAFCYLESVSLSLTDSIFIYLFINIKSQQHII